MSRKLKDAMDRSLSGIDFGVRLSDGVMRRIENAEGEGDIMKRKMAVSLVLMLLVLVLAAGAIAAVYLSGTIDWFGNPVQQMEEVASTPVPTASQDLGSTKDDIREKLLSGKPDNEIWVFRYDDGSGEMSGAVEMIPTLDDLKKRINGANLPFLVPNIPEGYRLKSARLQFFFEDQTLTSVKTVEMKTLDSGMTLRRYQPGDDAKENIQNYDLWFENAQGNQIIVTAWLTNSQGSYEFGVSDIDTYEVVSVSGMEKALYIERKGIDYALHLMQSFISPIQYVSPFAIESDYKWRDQTNTYNAVIYEIKSASAGKDVLISIANSLK